MANLPRRFLTRLILTSLILLFWITRLIDLDGLAYFIDEANHLWWARLVWQGDLFLAASDGRLLNVLWMAVFWPFNNGIWTSRASVVLITVIGFACLLAFAHRAFSLRAAVITGLVYIFLPLTFFFERMALADSLSAPFIAVTLWAIGRSMPYKALTRRSLAWAVIAGAAITCAIFVKLSNIIFVCIPFFAGVFLVERVNWRRGLQWVAVMISACLITLLPTAYFVHKLGQSDLGLDLLTLKTSVPLEQLPAEVWGAVQAVAIDFNTYLPFSIWPLLLLGVLLAATQKNRMTWFLLATLIATLAALVGRTSPMYLESRFLPVYAPLTAALAGAGLARLKPNWNPIWMTSGVLVLLLPGILFTWQAWQAPETLALPPDDRWQYITGWPSGYGYREVAEAAIEQDAPLELMTLGFGAWERLEANLIGNTTSVHVSFQTSKPRLNRSGWLAVDLPEEQDQLTSLDLNLTEVARYPRPGNESAVVVYRINP